MTSPDANRELTYKLCPRCDFAAKHVLYFTDENRPVRTGWYCAPCKHFMPAIGRERIVTELNPE